MRGEVNARTEAVLPVHIRAARGQVEEIEAVIDMGFSGYLALPPPMVAALQLPRFGTSSKSGSVSH